jgi:16S rRNA G527 N7-methylase RsmG
MNHHAKRLKITAAVVRMRAEAVGRTNPDVFANRAIGRLGEFLDLSSWT